MEAPLDETLISGVYGVSPEIVDKALDKAVWKLSREIEKLKNTLVEIRKTMESRRELFEFGVAGPPRELCYVAVDSSFTAPAIELVGGYLGLVNVVSVLYGSKCVKGGEKTVEPRVYIDLWFNDDLTSITARYYERLVAGELLEKKKEGVLDFDVLLLDGELIPRTLPRSGLAGERLKKTVDLTNEIIELADSTNTALVGVLKRSYSRDIVNILGYGGLRLSDKAVLSLILKPLEYVIAGSHHDINSELEKLEGKPGVQREWLKTRLKWYESIVNNIPMGYTVKLAFYRAPTTIYPVATKIEYITSDTLEDDSLISSIIHISGETGIPIPVDYADTLSTITKELKQTVYQKLLAELAKNTKIEAKDAILLLSLTNPEKLRHLY